MNEYWTISSSSIRSLGDSIVLIIWLSLWYNSINAAVNVDLPLPGAQDTRIPFDLFLNKSNKSLSRLYSSIVIFFTGLTAVSSNPSERAGYTITILYGPIWSTLDSSLLISKKASSLFSTSLKSWSMRSSNISFVIISLGSTTGFQFPGVHFFLKIGLFTFRWRDIVVSSKYLSSTEFPIICSVIIFVSKDKSHIHCNYTPKGGKTQNFMTFSFILNKTRRNIVKNQKKSREIAFLL